MVLKILVATRKGLFTLARNGSGTSPWQIERTDFLADNVSLVLHDARSGRLYAALDHGHFGVKLHTNDGDGAPWRELPAPVYPEKPADAPDKDMWGNPLPWSTVRVWALETGAPSQDGVIWCGTIPGGLFRSEDHGESWSMIESLWRHPKRQNWMGGGADLPGLHSICVDPRDPATIRVAVSTGGVWETSDSGATWHNDNTGMWQDHAPEESRLDPNGQDAHRLVQCPAKPDRMWIQHHNGIFRSDDSGKTWNECLNVSPSSFGFAVAVHPKDPDTAWFIPEIKDERRIPADDRLVVTRTRDGGKTFEVLSDGLPKEPTFDIVYRHALDVDSSGEALAMGSTTGGVWISENQGNNWTLAAGRFPPVYAVRFMET
ncbi:MAG: hypothetical protein KDJ17_05720 [Hyphomicrobiaceae bacterium]|nr:hypothetical protein [Hyphomicrobiaceae bacterium]